MNESCDLKHTDGVELDFLLISVLTIQNNEVDMHDLLQHMGWEIGCKQCLKEPRRRSRLREREDVHHVLTRNTVSTIMNYLIYNQNIAIIYIYIYIYI